MVIFHEKAGNPSFSHLEARLTPESLNNGIEPFPVKITLPPLVFRQNK